MYTPASFAVNSQDALFHFLERYSFATLISVIDGVPFATHLPLLLDQDGGVLLGHVAKANAHWQSFDGQSEALAIFQGPHAYISPTWYATSPAVPTWNYTAVHVYGPPRVIDEPQRASKMVDQLVNKYEATQPNPWQNELPGELREKLLASIVGFEMPIARIEGKFKFSQNRSAADQASMLRHLETGPADAAELAAFIREHTAPANAE